MLMSHRFLSNCIFISRSFATGSIFPRSHKRLVNYSERVQTTRFYFTHDSKILQGIKTRSAFERLLYLNKYLSGFSGSCAGNFNYLSGLSGLSNTL